jgi:hypothetical protein
VLVVHKVRNFRHLVFELISETDRCLKTAAMRGLFCRRSAAAGRGCGSHARPRDQATAFGDMGRRTACSVQVMRTPKQQHAAGRASSLRHSSGTFLGASTWPRNWKPPLASLPSCAPSVTALRRALRKRPLVEKALDYLRDNARAAAQARANRVYMEEFRKTVKAQINGRVQRTRQQRTRAFCSKIGI